jgi:NADH:ubiquinone oxidoreductase subunit 3 (subunit A)
MLRKVLAALIAILVAVLITVGFEHFCTVLYPYPPGMDTTDHFAMEAFTETLPSSYLLITITGWAVASFAAGLVIRLIVPAGSRTSAYLTALFLMTVGIVRVFMLPYPLWFRIAGICVFIPFTLLGHTLKLRNGPAAPEINE